MTRPCPMSPWAISGYSMFALMNFISSCAPPGNSGMTAATSRVSFADGASSIVGGTKPTNVILVESGSFCIKISPDVLNGASRGGGATIDSVSFSTIGIVSSTGVGHISPNITLALVESLIVS